MEQHRIWVRGVQIDHSFSKARKEYGLFENKFSTPEETLLEYMQPTFDRISELKGIYRNKWRQEKNNISAFKGWQRSNAIKRWIDCNRMLKYYDNKIIELKKWCKHDSPSRWVGFDRSKKKSYKDDWHSRSSMTSVLKREGVLDNIENNQISLNL